jgi:hypothetical protein
LSIIKFVALCFGIALFPVAMGSFIIVAFGQNASPSPSPTPTITLPPPVTTTPSPNLQYVPQKAYIVTTPDGTTQAFPVADQDNSGGTTTAQATGIVGIIAGIATGLYAKFQGSRDNKQTNAAVLSTKDVQKEIARVMYNFQPDQSKALSDAPSIKLETLEKDRAEFAEKVAKS